MSLDAVVLLVLLLFAVAGAITGALRQLVTLAAALAGWAAARLLAPLVAPLLFDPAPHPWQRAAAAVGCFALAWLVVSLVGGAMARQLHGPSGTPGGADRALGALLGSAKAGLVAWVLLSALALAHGPIGVGSLRLDVHRSRCGAFAARHNLLEAADPAAARRVEKLLEAVGPDGGR